MIISASNVTINFEHFPSVEKESTYLFLLHGFTGSSNDWMEIIPNLNKKFPCVAIDLIGHGKSESPKELEHYKTPSLIAQIDDVFRHFTKNEFVLIGYSMGGRAALSYAAAHPDNLVGLILESTSAGIADEKLREERVLSDEKIIKRIEEKSIEEFIDYWMNQDLFASLKKLPREKFLESQMSKVKSLSRSPLADGSGIKSKKLGLINSLKGFGTGVMPPLHSKLKSIKCKSMLITGELDKKFTQINSELVKSLPSAKHVVIKNAGHNVHFEKPEKFVEMVNGFLEKN